MYCSTLNIYTILCGWAIFYKDDTYFLSDDPNSLSFTHIYSSAKDCFSHFIVYLYTLFYIYLRTKDMHYLFIIHFLNKTIYFSPIFLGNLASLFTRVLATILYTESILICQYYLLNYQYSIKCNICYSGHCGPIQLLFSITKGKVKSRKKLWRPKITDFFRNRKGTSHRHDYGWSLTQSRCKTF